MEQPIPSRLRRVFQSGDSPVEGLDKSLLASLLAHTDTTTSSRGSSHIWQEKIHLYSVVDSTNNAARQMLTEAITESPLHHPDGSLTSHGRKLHGSLFLAEHQTAGRGRQGRCFHSPESVGLYLSVVVVPQNGITEPALITATSALSVCRSLEQVYGIRAEIKWVNDIIYQGKKVCGILTEGVADPNRGNIPAAIIGIGVNVTASKEGFPEELEGIAGTLLPPEETNLQRNQLAAAIVLHLIKDLDSSWQQNQKHHSTGGIMEEYRQRCILKPGQKVVVFPIAGSTEASYPATVLGIDHRARLQVQLEDGSQKLLDSGEVSLKSGSFTG